MEIAVIGQGYVGLSLAASALNAGFKVLGFDVNTKLVNELKIGKTEIPGISGDFLTECIKKNSYMPTTNPQDLENSKIIIIAVPTPLDKNRLPDLSYLKNAAEVIAQNVVGEVLVINESTSYPGTLRDVIKVICDKSKKAKFHFAAAPERIDPGNNQWTIKNTPRVVSGLTESAGDMAVDFYKRLCSNVYRVETVEVAEASKLFENTFRQVNIALANEFSNIASKLGFLASDAIKAAATKPFGFMPFSPSIGVGGHCIPIDPTYLSYTAERIGIKAGLIKLANDTNLSMAKNIAFRIKDELGGALIDKHIQIAGIAYKAGVSDMRESPSLDLIQELKNLGAKTSWFDPLVTNYNNEHSTPLNPNIDLGLIISPHEQIDFSIWLTAGTKVFDLSANSNNYGWPKFL